MSQQDPIPDELMNKLLDLCQTDHKEPSHPEQPNHDKTQGDQYENFELIGSGGMKEVYKAYDKKNGRHVAYATLKEDAPAELTSPFLREAKITALLDHPNIITLYEVGQNDQPYFTMELKTGQGLDQLIQEHQSQHLDKQLFKRLSFFMQVCDAMEYAHHLGVLHLDLKPENIQIGQYGDVVVCDWGLAKVIHEEEPSEDLLLNPDLLNHMTLHHKMKGTPGYMSPEQIKKNHAFDQRSDTFSLGCILFQLVYLKEAFPGETDTQLTKTLSGDINKQVSPKISSSLKAIVLKSIASDQKNRYQNVTQLKGDLTRFLEGFPTLAEHANWNRRFKLFYTRHQYLMITISIASIMFITTLLIYISELKNSEQKALDSQSKAESALELAQESQQRAEHHLNALVNELNNSQFNIMKSFMMYRPTLTLKLAKANIEELINLGPQNNTTWGDYGDILFLEHNYQLAYKNYQKCHEPWVQERLDIIKSLSLQNRNSPLQFQELKTMVKVLDKIPELQGCLLALHSDRNRNLHRHADLLEIALRTAHPQWEGAFNFRSTGASLTLSGKELTHLTRNQACILKYLNLRELVLENTSISPYELLGLKIRTLRIHKTNQLEDFKWNQLSHLKNLYIDSQLKHQIDIKFLMSKGIQVHLVDTHQ